jgi:hypothetical protein
VGAEEGGGLGATNIVLSPCAARPDPYFWPAPPRRPGSARGALPQWGAALVAVGAALAAAAAAALALALRRRQRRRRAPSARGAASGGGAAARLLGRRKGAGAGGEEGPGDGDGDGDDTSLARDAGRRLAAVAAAADRAARPPTGAGAAGGLEEDGGPALILGQAAAPAAAPAEGAGSGDTSSGDAGMENRWRELSRRIGKRISMIHMHKLKSAMSEGVGPAPSEAAGGDDDGGGDARSAGGAGGGGGGGSRLSEGSTSIDLQLLAPIGQVRTLVGQGALVQQRATLQGGTVSPRQARAVPQHVKELHAFEHAPPCRARSAPCGAASCRTRSTSRSNVGQRAVAERHPPRPPFPCLCPDPPASAACVDQPGASLPS